MSQRPRNVKLRAWLIKKLNFSHLILVLITCNLKLFTNSAINKYSSLCRDILFSTKNNIFENPRSKINHSTNKILSKNGKDIC